MIPLRGNHEDLRNSGRKRKSVKLQIDELLKELNLIEEADKQARQICGLDSFLDVSTEPVDDENSSLDDADAIQFFQTLINESVSALFPQMVETIHRWAQYWR